MPLYEFYCQKCRKKFTFLCKIAERDDPRSCEYCGATDCQRLVARVKTVRSEEQIMESLSDATAFAGLDENDPRTFTTWAKKMTREMGEDMDEEIESMAQEEFGSASAQPDQPDQPSLGPDDDFTSD